MQNTIKKTLLLIILSLVTILGFQVRVLASGSSTLRLTIDDANIDETLTNFPVTVKIDNSDILFGTLTVQNFNFKSSNGDQLLYEIEYFSNTDSNENGDSAVFHVLIPSVSASSVTNFDLYYGTDIIGQESSTLNDMTGLQTIYEDGVTLSTISGMDKKAVFDGSSVVTIKETADELNVGLGDFTVEFKFLGVVDEVNSYPRILSNHNTSSRASVSGNLTIEYDRTSNRDLRFYSTYNSESYELISSNTYNDGNFHDVAFVRRSGILYLYVDGKYDNSIAFDIPIDFALDSNDMHIGGEPGQYYYDGEIKGLKISDVALYSGTNTSQSNYIIPSTYVNDTNTIFATNFDTVWDENYTSVLHMNVDSANNVTYDSVNGNELSTVGLASSVSSDGYYVVLDDVTSSSENRYVRLNPSIFGTEDGTYTYGISNLHDSSEIFNTLISAADAFEDNKLIYGVDESEKPKMELRTQSGSAYATDTFSTSLSTSSFNYSAFRFDFDTNATTYSSFTNGIKDTDIVKSASSGHVFTPLVAILGQELDGSYTSTSDVPYIGSTSDEMIADLYEFRVSNIARSDAWIKAETLTLNNELVTGLVKITGSSSNANYENTEITVDSTIEILSSEEITSGTVQIANGVDGDTLTEPTGCTYNSTTFILSCSGYSTTSELETAFNNVKFSTTSTDNTDREISFSLGSVKEFNDHYYQYIASEDILWTTAKAEAEQKSFYGLQGYLVTITSAEENDFVTSKLEDNSWIGASRDSTYTLESDDNYWEWVTGPETGTNLGQMNPSYVDNVSTYDNFGTGEPNGTGENTGEMYGQIRIYTGAEGLWNDLVDDSNHLSADYGVNGYIVEYGGMTDDASPTLTFTKTVNMKTAITSSDGDSSSSTTYYDVGDIISSLTNFTKTGYTQTAWNPVLPYTVTSTDATLTAVWTANTNTITLNKNGGTGGTDSLTMTYDELYPASLTPPTREGHTFTGYNSSLSGIYTDSYDGDGNVIDVNGEQRVWSGTNDYTWYAQWDINQYTISFNENDGSVVDDITQDYLSDVTAPTPPTKLGYNFGGWYSDSGLTSLYTFGTMPASDTTLYAKWLVDSFSLTFDENGGSAVADTNEEYNTSISKPADPTRTGYAFINWFTDSNFTSVQVFPFTMPASNKTLYAKWDANTYTVTFDANNSSGLTSTQNIAFDTPVNLTVNAFTKTGYDFAGWNTDANGNGTSYTDQELYSITSDSTLYAQWTIGNYTISFEENGGSTVSDITGNYGDLVTSPTDPTKTNSDFLGWYSDSALTTTYTFTTIPSSNITVYAKWSNDIDVQYNTIPLIRTLNIDVVEELVIEVGCDYDIEFIGYELYGYYKVDLTNDVTISGYVDTHKPGTYPITLELEYNGRQVIKEVNVKVIDVKPPVITNSTGVLYYGREHELDFTATDDCLDVDLEIESYNNGLVKYVTVTATDMSGNQTVEQYELPIVFAKNHIKQVEVLGNTLIFVFNEADFDIPSLEVELVILEDEQKIEVIIKDKNNKSLKKEISFFEINVELDVELRDFSF